MEYIFFIILLVIMLFGVIVTFFWKGKKGLSTEKKKHYEQEIRKISTLPSPTERIMKYDIILQHILRDSGYEGNVWDQLKAKPVIIKDLDAIWELHKLRNRLAHDMGTIATSVLEKKSHEFEKELRGLL